MALFPFLCTNVNQARSWNDRTSERTTERIPRTNFSHAPGTRPRATVGAPTQLKGEGVSIRSLALSGAHLFARSIVRALLPAPLQRDGFPSGNPRRGVGGGERGG
jgi:hypothetical protein